MEILTLAAWECLNNHLVQSVVSEDIHNIQATLFTESYIQQHLHRPIGIMFLSFYVFPKHWI